MMKNKDKLKEAKRILSRRAELENIANIGDIIEVTLSNRKIYCATHERCGINIERYKYQKNKDQYGEFGISRIIGFYAGIERNEYADVDQIVGKKHFKGASSHCDLENPERYLNLNHSMNQGKIIRRAITGKGHLKIPISAIEEFRIIR